MVMHRKGLIWLVIVLVVLAVGNGRLLAQTPEPAPPPPDTTLIPLIHTVQDGENLTIIAQNYGVTVEELLVLNGLTDEDVLFVGQELIIPGGEGEAVATVYQAQVGDTLAGVAAAFNTTHAALVETNRVINPYYSLTAGVPVTVISQTGSALPQPVTGTPHVVGFDETLPLIALKYQLSPAELAQANGLAAHDVVVPGQRLRIPAEAPYQFLTGGWQQVQVRPLPVTPGDTVSIFVAHAQEGQPTGQFAGQNLRFFPHEAGFAALVGIGAFTEPGRYTLRLEGGSDRPWQPFQQDIFIQAGSYGIQPITVSEEQAPLLAPEVRQEEDVFLSTIYTNFTEAPLWEGVFQVPVTATIVTAPYGDGRSYNGGPVEIYHTGIDFAGTIGTPILAPANGRVAYTGLLKLRGNAVVIDHGVGVMSAYFHLSEIFVTEGDEVLTGQPIGAGGSTGLSTGPHLHWDLRINDVPIDGEQWLSLTFP